MKQFFAQVGSHLSIVGELLTFFWERKLWWLMPMLLLLLFFGILVLFSQNAVIAPFIYTIF